MNDPAGAVPVDEVAGVCRGWISPEPAYQRRASHAVLAGGRVWLVDPVDEPGMVERAVALGPPAAVVQLLDRHNRDCAAIAARLGVPHIVLPDAPPAGAPFEVIGVVRRRRWQERALWFPEHRTLVVADALGTAPYYRGRDEVIGVHPLLRIARPPGMLLGRDPRHVLCGHGAGVHGPEAAPAVERAVRGARRAIPGWAWRLIRRARD